MARLVRLEFRAIRSSMRCRFPAGKFVTARDPARRFHPPGETATPSRWLAVRSLPARTRLPILIIGRRRPYAAANLHDPRPPSWSAATGSFGPADEETHALVEPRGTIPGCTHGGHPGGVLFEPDSRLSKQDDARPAIPGGYPRRGSVPRRWSLCPPPRLRISGHRSPE